MNLYLEVGDFAWIEWARQLRGELEVGVVEVDREFALLVERVLEVDPDRLCSWGALDWTLRLRCLGFAEEQARILHSFWA